jgi:hypothetical protein
MAGSAAANSYEPKSMGTMIGLAVVLPGAGKPALKQAERLIAQGLHCAWTGNLVISMN